MSHAKSPGVTAARVAKSELASPISRLRIEWAENQELDITRYKDGAIQCRWIVPSAKGYDHVVIVEPRLRNAKDLEPIEQAIHLLLTRALGLDDAPRAMSLRFPCDTAGHMPPL